MVVNTISKTFKTLEIPILAFEHFYTKGSLVNNKKFP